MNNEVLRKTTGVKDIAIMGLFIAIVYVATAFILVPGPSEGGLFHMGNVAHFTIAIVFGRKKGAISGAFGMALFDILSPYAAWAPFTFIIRFAIGYVIGYIAHMNGKRGANLIQNIISMIPATIIMIGGYYMAEGIMYGNWISPAVSIPGNAMQCLVGAISIIIAPILIKTFKARRIEIEI
ncbi:ECF transporter S component [Oceanirhabdus seepicola]|uniref:ECF transporter S component n=1 Tax=Oceanirhabdus seepicola TaxID=2828781 RepID=A0A9J6NV72_9CLOT|nr:ECF transporter S component [Oceanirhabdus seepicola]MCM1988383.1 ECF transporter S component [Oceanirhabdus seepicola]